VDNSEQKWLRPCGRIQFVSYLLAVSRQATCAIAISVTAEYPCLTISAALAR
jgi:hypothetical protein